MDEVKLYAQSCKSSYTWILQKTLTIGGLQKLLQVPDTNPHINDKLNYTIGPRP